MKEVFTKFWILCASVVVILMAAILIVIVHIAKLIRKFGYGLISLRASQ